MIWLLWLALLVTCALIAVAALGPREPQDWDEYAREERWL